MMARTWTVSAATLLLAGGLAACSHIPLRRSQIERVPNPCADFTASIYFERNSEVVTREARDVLKGAAGVAKGCEVKGVDVVGLADSLGAPDANLELSKRRARAVTAALSRAGFRDTAISISAVGEAGAQTPSGGVAPLRRRADVNIHLSKP